MIALMIRILLVVCMAGIGYLAAPVPWAGALTGLGAALALVAAEYAMATGLGWCASVKLLDTSVIIDGRITDICRTGFMEGPLVIPGFVLLELQRVADSADVLKRNRGRRGLDTLAQLRQIPMLKTSIWNRDIPGAVTVDEKLVRLAKQTGGKLVTNDINLNKIATLQGVKVLNINDLTNAVKTVVLPGEEFSVRILREGKEPGQGVGYLEDGTMVVVENGRDMINQRQTVAVTSVLQTTAGRMIFARLKAGG